jgi:hypothetical protein
VDLDHRFQNDFIDPSPPGDRRAPPRYVKCLLPIWGYRYVRQFLDVSLPTWLAQGNLPALAATLPTEFVILTSREDELFIRHHPMFAKLKKICPVGTHYIDHLITNSNYSTTITLAYTEAVRSAGPDMLDTCFFFLVSDYIVADHSFSNVLKRIMNGCSGVQVGNFQVAAEAASPWLLEKLNGVSGAIGFSSRELMRWGLSHLHPATVANIVNYPLTHNHHANRLFWRVDSLTLIGRFYLMHMICVRPERTDFIIGSSCDYSFIPEMCPSGDIQIIADSDEYLVIEMQPRAHESAMLRMRRQTVNGLAKTLSEWTTPRHRENAETTVVFHAGEFPAQLPDAKSEADRFVAAVRRQMERPSPFRDHPYWRGAIAAFKEATGLRLTRSELRYALGLEHPDFSRSRLKSSLSRILHFVLLGAGPKLRPWHPRWPDHELVLRNIGPVLGRNDKKLLLVGNAPTIFSTAIPDSGERHFRIQTNILLRHPPEFYNALAATFDVCLIEMEESDTDKCSDLIDRVAPLMKKGATVLLSIYNRRGLSEARHFTRKVSLEAARMLRPCVISTKCYFVKAAAPRWLCFRSIIKLLRLARERPIVGAPLLAVTGLPLAIGAWIANRLSGTGKVRPPRGIASSFLMTMRVDHDETLNAYVYSPEYVRRDRNRLGGARRGNRAAQPGAGVRLASDVAPIVGETRPADELTPDRSVNAVLS